MKEETGKSVHGEAGMVHKTDQADLLEGIAEAESSWERSQTYERGSAPIESEAGNAAHGDWEKKFTEQQNRMMSRWNEVYQ